MHMDNSCKRRAYCLHRSFVVVHTEHGQWQASFTREKSACLVEVSVMEQILWEVSKLPEILAELNIYKQCVQALFFFVPMHESLGMRLRRS